jgi:hypothetical protein
MLWRLVGCPLGFKGGVCASFHVLRTPSLVFAALVPGELVLTGSCPLVTLAVGISGAAPGRSSVAGILLGWPKALIALLGLPTLTEQG